MISTYIYNYFIEKYYYCMSLCRYVGVLKYIFQVLF